mgnify:CR=1 FL=1
MRVKSKKKLALLVGMALTVGSTLAVNPMDVYAASVTWDAEGSEYKVLVGESTTTFTDAGQAVDAVIAGLKNDKKLTIDFSEAAWSNNQKEANDLVGALGDKKVTLQGGAKVDLTYADGGKYVFANGAGESKLTLGKANNVLTIDGDMDSVNIKVGSAKDAEIKVETGKKVSNITIEDGSAKELKLTGEGTVSNLEAQGDITVSATDTKLTNIAVAEGKTLTTSGAVTAGSITGNGNVTANGALNVTGDISAASVTTTGALTATKVTAGTVKADSVAAEVKADSLVLTGNSKLDVNGDAKAWDVGTLKTGGNLTVSDASKLKANSIESTGNLEISDANNTLSADKITSGGTLTIGADTKVDAKDITSTGALTIANGENVAPDANITAKSGLTVTAGNLTAGSLSVNGALTATDEKSTITADSVTFGSGASIASTKANIKADAVTIDTTSMTKDEIAKLKIEPKTENGTVNVKVISNDGALTDEIKDAITTAVGDNKVTVSATSEAAETAKEKADEAIAKADEELGKVNEFAAKDAAKIAQANPFTTKLPSASDIAAVASPTDAQKQSLETAKGELKTAIQGVDTQIEAAKSANNEPLQKDLEAKKAELEAKKAGLSTEGLQAKAAELTAAVQQAGKTAAAPGVASARTATVVTNVMTANVTGRTSELRGFASAVDEGRPAPDNVWFQYKHTNMDVDNGDVYGKSTVKTNNYQLGYDAKVGPNDYLGAYIGTTTGNVEFNAPAVTDRTDIDNAYDFGIYGTHMLPSDQYIDYMIHTGKFDSKYNGVTWGTKDTGAMIGYGAKIAQNDRLTWNPYIQLAYDKVSVDSYMAGPNYIASDDSNNWTAKLGINLLDVSGFYGGLAYSRGLSGSYNAYINGVPMPSQDNNANVLYMSLGYRANMSRNVFLDLSMEKTFADYNGWTAAGKVNFYF